MADFPPGSRAIKIPIHLGTPGDHSTTDRRRRNARHIPTLSRADSADGGPASSASSEAESSWPSEPHSLIAYQARTSIASPSTKDPRLAKRNDAESSKRKDKQKETRPSTPPATPPSSIFTSSSPLGPSMLSSSSYKSVNLNSHHENAHEPPRLITYTKHSQGFTWNDELFLPSYLIGRHGGHGLGRRKHHDADFGDEDDDGTQVTEIFVTDEEAEAMMP